MTRYTLSQIVEQLGGKLIGSDAEITAVAPAVRAAATEITFLANPKYKAEAEESAAAAIIVSPKAAEHFSGRNLIGGRPLSLFRQSGAAVPSDCCAARGRAPHRRD